MPTSFMWDFYPQRIKQRQTAVKERKRKHDEVVRAWKAGELSWNEYVRLEKKYRT